MLYLCFNPDSSIAWSEWIPLEKFGKTRDDALATFLLYITHMDQW